MSTPVQASDFANALAFCRAAVDHGADLTGQQVTLIIKLLEYSANTLDTTNLQPPVMVDPVDDGSPA